MSKKSQNANFNGKWLPEVLSNVRKLISYRPNNLNLELPELCQIDAFVVNDNDGPFVENVKDEPRTSRARDQAVNIYKRNRVEFEDDNDPLFYPGSYARPSDSPPIVSRLLHYTFYSVLNTGIAMDPSTSASALCRSFLALYVKLDRSPRHADYLDAWDKGGQKIVVLEGYNHKHLQYLANEVRHVAVNSNTLSRTTGKSRLMLVLTAFGREVDMEEAFDDLSYLH